MCIKVRKALETRWRGTEWEGSVFKHKDGWGFDNKMEKRKYEGTFIPAWGGGLADIDKEIVMLNKYKEVKSVAIIIAVNEGRRILQESTELDSL